MKETKELIEILVLFSMAGIFTILKKGLLKGEKWYIEKTLSKFFVNIVVGVSFYSFLLSYHDWYGQYPQKIGVVMAVTYFGTNVLDLLTERLYDFIKGGGFKDLIKFLFKL